MQWNWQHKDWPEFTWNTDALDAYERTFLHETGVIVGAAKHFSADDKTRIIIDVITDEAMKTSEIEGEQLNRDSVQSSIRKHFGLKTEHRRIEPAEHGIAEMMTDLYHRFDKPLSHETLFNWHEMLTNGRRDLHDIGRYRTHEDAMQVVSGPDYKRKVHFEAPPSQHMPQEMTQFLAWFSNTAPDGMAPLPPLTRAGIAHLYFVTVHPFEDGNGRIGRAIAEKSLSENLGQPTLIALSQTIEAKRKAYYDALEASNKTLDITDWLEYFAQTVLEAQQRTLALMEFILQKTKLYDRIGDKLNARQEKAISRLFRAGPDGFVGGLSAENYISITGTSRATATRDLQGLVEMGALRKTGERKSTRYWLQ